MVYENYFLGDVSELTSGSGLGPVQRKKTVDVELGNLRIRNTLDRVPP